MSNDKNPKDLKADAKQDEGGKPSSNPDGAHYGGNHRLDNPSLDHLAQGLSS